MSQDKLNPTTLPETEAPEGLPVDQQRRKLTKAGIVGSGVILTLASRSAIGGWGVCTGSELMSGNLSRAGDANPCGCSPGYWGNTNGYATWMAQLGKLINSTYGPTAKFKDVFGVSFFVDNTTTLLQAVRKERTPKTALCGRTSLSEGFLKTAAFHAVAALLNASVYGSRYPVPVAYQTPAGVISAFASAYTCGLTDFVTKVDIYSTAPNLWCFGAEENL